MWKLSYFDKGENFIGRFNSGDTAKSHARAFQIGFGSIPLFRIYAPDGSIWMEGKAQLNHVGFRMKWWYPKYRLGNK